MYIQCPTLPPPILQQNELQNISCLTPCIEESRLFPNLEPRKEEIKRNDNRILPSRRKTVTLNPSNGSSVQFIQFPLIMS